MMRTLSVLQTGRLLVKNVIAAAWSPRGTYLQTFERPSKELGNAHKNLKVPVHAATLCSAYHWGIVWSGILCLDPGVGFPG